MSEEEHICWGQYFTADKSSTDPEKLLTKLINQLPIYAFNKDSHFTIYEYRKEGNVLKKTGRILMVNCLNFLQGHYIFKAKSE
jgi:hypothetical protein